MAHTEQQEFFNDLTIRLPEYFNSSIKVLEVGSQNINGSIRQFFSRAESFVGLDLSMADDVDWTIPGELVELPDCWADTSVSTECFEHCKDWKNVFLNMIRITKPGGLIIITCASTCRATHGTIDSDIESSPFTSNYYKNISLKDLSNAVDLSRYFTKYSLFGPFSWYFEQKKH